MTLEELIFEESDFVGKDIASLPDRVIGAAEELKARFDYIAKEMLALGRFNELLRLLGSSECAGELGFQATEALPVRSVQQAIEALSAQLRAAALGQLPDGSVTAEKLAEGAALQNLAEGSITEKTLAEGAALRNLADGSITEEKLEESLKQDLKSAVTLESLTTVLEDWSLAGGGGTLELSIPVDLRHFLSGSGGRIVVRIAPGSWRCTELEIRHDPAGSGLCFVVRGACAETTDAAARDGWQSVWIGNGGKLLYYDGTQESFLGLHSLMEMPDTGDSLGTPRLSETALTLPISWTAAAEHTLRAAIQVEVWR